MCLQKIDQEDILVNHKTRGMDKKISKRIRITLHALSLGLFVMFFAVNIPVKAQEAETKDEELEQLDQLSLEEFLELETSTASKSSQRLEEAPGIVTVITRNQIEEMGARSLEDVLNQVPGFTVGRSLQLGFHKTIHVRGIFSTNASGILFLINGQRLNDGLSGGAVSFTSQYSVTNIKQIEIIRGPGSALYGANAFLGVVNIITNDAEDLDGGFARYRIGAQNKLQEYKPSHQAEFAYGRSINEDINFTLYGNMNLTSLYNMPMRTIRRNIVDNQFAPMPLNMVYENRINQEHVDFYDFGASFSFKSLTLDASFSTSDQYNNYAGGTAVDMDGKEFANLGDMQNFRVGLNHDWDMADKVMLHTKASYLKHESTPQYRVNNFVPLGYLGAYETIANQSIYEGIFSKLEWKTSTIYLDSYADYKVNEKINLIAGVNFQQDFVEETIDMWNVRDTTGNGLGNVNVGEFGPSPVPQQPNKMSETTRNVFAGYTQLAWELNSTFTFTGGVRFDYYDDFGSTINPRAALVVKPTEELTAKLLYGSAFRAPTLYEMEYDATNAIVSSSDLNPETIQTFEAQLNYQPIEELRLSVNGFIYSIDDVIRQVSTNRAGAETEVRQINGGNRKATGVEAEVRYQPKKEISVFANYSFTDSEDEYAGETNPVAGVPRQGFNAGARFSLFENNVDLYADVGRRWDWNNQPEILLPAARQMPDILGGLIYYMDEFEIPSYTIVSARATWKNAFTEGLNFSIQVHNLFDEIPLFPDQHTFAPEGIPVGGTQTFFSVSYDF